MRSYYPGYGEKTGRTAIFILFLIGLALTIGLYFVKTRAQTAKAEAAQLQRLVTSEQNAVKVLRAELAHLQSPDRLGVMAENELGLVPAKAEQIVSIAQIEEMFPLRQPVKEGAGEASKKAGGADE